MFFTKKKQDNRLKNNCRLSCFGWCRKPLGVRCCYFLIIFFTMVAPEAVAMRTK